MASRRIPESLAPNEWSRGVAARRAAGVRLLDLTESNPTRVGLGGDVAPATSAAERYEPDPRGLLPAREAVAAICAERGAPLAPEDVVLTSGTSESYAHLFRLLTDPGDVVLIPSPSYPLFEPIAALESVRVVPYRLAWDGAWHLDLGSVEAALETSRGQVRALIVVEPNHPTGSCLTAEEREALERLLERHRVALVSDEVFGDFPWDPALTHLPGLLGERRVPTFVLGGISKGCGLPQLKLAWIAVAGPEPARRRLVEGLEWISDLFLSVASPVQRALPALLEGRRPYLAKVRERLAANLGSMGRLAERRLEVTLMPGRGGWTLVMRLPATGEEWWRALLERDVVVHPGYFYGLEPEGCVATSLIVEPAVLREAAERLEAILATA